MIVYVILCVCVGLCICVIVCDFYEVRLCFTLVCLCVCVSV